MVDVNLRRQILALEEAGIIPFGKRDIPGEGDASAGQGKAVRESGGLGNLDVGWLNSRNDKVGKEMEAELWMQARELVDSLVADKRENSSTEEMDRS